jgi:hypothetical protein
LGSNFSSSRNEEVNVEGFDHILNWRLLRGSHEFPGKDGGTCINEAAVIAAGFDYRRIYNVTQMPSCFSRPICEFAMFLNDQASNEERQRLLPFVMRLACADTEEMEQERQRYISAKTTRYMPMSEGIEILEGALAIGRQADPIVLPIVEERMSAAQRKASSTTSKASKPLLANVKKLLNAL